MQRAEFDRLDMLAQQEARAKVREKQLFGQAMAQVAKLKVSLSERSDSAEELVRLLNVQHELQAEVGELRRLSGGSPVRLSK